MRSALHVPNFADPRELVELGALAVRTSMQRLGTGVTPLARRRPHKVAREAVTVDRLSGGRTPPVQRPRIPVWTSCVVPHRAPLARAARWDGLILAGLTDAGGIEPVTADQLRDALAEVGVRRESLDGFDVAVVSPGLPGRALLDAYADLGATWVLATGWMEQVHEMAGVEPRP